MSAPEARPGLPFGPFRLLERLSVGGSAEVFLARDPADRTFALKRLLPHLAAESEADLLLAAGGLGANLDHPGIAKFHDAGHVGETSYLLLEHVDGVELTALVRRSLAEPAPPDLVAAIGHLAALALDHLHTPDAAKRRPGIVHGDISPQNFMMCSAGLKLIDLGLARPIGEPAPVLRGTHAYMSPEQVRLEPLEPRSDLFSLGVILWELAAGRRLFRADSPLETLARVEAADLPTVALPAPLGALIARCLARDPQARPTLRDLAASLAALVPAPVAVSLVAQAASDLTRDPVRDLVRYRASLDAMALGDDPQITPERSDITAAPGPDELAALRARLRHGPPRAIAPPSATSESLPAVSLTRPPGDV